MGTDVSNVCNMHCKYIDVIFTSFMGVPFSTVISLKSVYFNAGISFLSKLWYFCFDLH